MRAGSAVKPIGGYFLDQIFPEHASKIRLSLLRHAFRHRPCACKNDGLEIALDAGAEDFVVEDENYAIKTSPQDFFKVKKAIDDAKIKTEDAQLTLLPKSTVKVAGDDARKILDLVDSIEEHEDIQHVYANFDIPDELIK